jgi:SAM-dependent methyltransferase
MSEWPTRNQEMWDERVPLHVASDYYDVEGFKAGRGAVEPFEVDELGALGGCRLAHLQCHFGQDTLDLVRMHPTLEAVGLDFSPPAIEAATKLAEDLDLADRASFVCADVHDAADALGAGAFDVVYTGKGAICWLPDLRPWAEQCAALLKPGGWLYVCEFHPVGMCLDYQTPTIKHDYFNPHPIMETATGTYTDHDATTEHNVAYQWFHPLSKIFEAVLGVGFRLQFFHEWHYTIFDQFGWMDRVNERRFDWPGPGRLPLMYSLKAERVADQ